VDIVHTNRELVQYSIINWKQVSCSTFCWIKVDEMVFPSITWLISAVVIAVTSLWLANKKLYLRQSVNIFFLESSVVADYSEI